MTNELAHPKLFSTCSHLCCCDCAAGCLDDTTPSMEPPLNVVDPTLPNIGPKLMATTSENQHIYNLWTQTM